jgi:superfamily I DNA/RNA helicase
MKRLLILGGPGAGKTERLLKIMSAALAAGTRSDRIAFVSFTRMAVGEARYRAERQFGFAADELPYFRTVHSLAFRLLGLRRSDVLGDEHLAQLAEVTGELLNATSLGDIDGPAAGMSADPLLTVDHYARATMRTLREAWDDHGGELEWFRLKRFADAYSAFKEDMCLLDFTDILSSYVDACPAPAPVDVAIVDEAQDLTLLQWAVIERAFSGAAELYIAGDDLQSIHRWAGAADDHFAALDCDVEVLPVSHRLPRSVFKIASEVADRVSRKRPRTWEPADRSGEVAWAAGPDDVDLGSGTWLLLARTRAQLPPFVAAARAQGVVYSLKGASSVDAVHVRAIRAHEALRAGRSVCSADAESALAAAGMPRELGEEGEHSAADLGLTEMPIWHDALTRIPLETREYYLACLRRGEKIDRPPRVRIETIHGAKGAESENVLLGTDMTYRVQRGFELDPDSEHRVFYVGMTRASKRLFLIEPQTQYGYRL